MGPTLVSSRYQCPSSRRLPSIRKRSLAVTSIASGAESIAVRVIIPVVLTAISETGLVGIGSSSSISSSSISSSNSRDERRYDSERYNSE